MRSRLAIDRGVDRQHDLLDRIIGDAADEAFQVEIIGADAVQRRQGAAENVIARR